MIKKKSGLILGGFTILISTGGCLLKNLEINPIVFDKTFWMIFTVDTIDEMEAKIPNIALIMNKIFSWFSNLNKPSIIFYKICFYRI